MAARPGEDLAATLFADVHYYYGPPTAKPPHHRFDKSSYVYLFENASQRRARIEVANNAGTPEQDAFNGYLDNTHVHYSYKHSTLVTLTVDGAGQPIAGQNPQEWHLPTYDPRNENKYMYRLNTVDLYFWAKEDALVFVNATRRVLPTQQVSIVDEPSAPPAHQEEMSPVVQQLENIAITDPSYSHGQTRDSRTTTSSFSGPPISATPHSQEASNFAPMAYNPAAPAAPEAIRHREKTPPPEDGSANPLVAAASVDQGQSFGAPPYGQQGFSGPPSQSQPGSYYGTGGAASAPSTQYAQHQPPPSAGLTSPYAQHFQNTFAPPPTAESTRSPYGQPPPQVDTPVSAAPPPAYQQQAHIPVIQQSAYAQGPLSPGLSSGGYNTPGLFTPGVPSPAQNPNAAFMPPPVAPENPNAAFMPAGPPHPGLSHSQTAPPGGFSQYSYKQVSNTQPLQTDYSVHSQVYRPTESEANKGHGTGRTAKEKPPTGKLEERAGRLEKGINGMLKKLEKKIG